MGSSLNDIHIILKSFLITILIIVAALAIPMLIAITPVAILFGVVYFTIKYWDDDLTENENE